MPSILGDSERRHFHGFKTHTAGTWRFYLGLPIVAALAFLEIEHG